MPPLFDIYPDIRTFGLEAVPSRLAEAEREVETTEDPLFKSKTHTSSPTSTSRWFCRMSSVLIWATSFLPSG
ncbi:MAG: hypothetical protein ACU841_12655, partial [Gammaproteobacteria bacterium]